MTTGQFLRSKREEKKLSLQQVAEKTNIRINFLEAIENGELDLIPSLSQARGFMRLYATFLGLNPLELFDRIENPEIITSAELPDNKGGAEIPDTILVEEHKSVDKNNRKKKIVIETKEVIHPFSSSIFIELGNELRQRREALGLSREDVERQIKIREFFVYALESGKIGDLPSTVQGRGMLSNYAEFLSLDSDSFQIRYAEGLQQRRLERVQEEEKVKKSGKPVIGKEPLTGWRRLLTPDLIVGGGMFIVLFSLVIWGAYQVIRTSTPQSVSTLESISEVLIGTKTEGIESTSGGGSFLATNETPVILETPLENLQQTITAAATGPIQIVIIARQRAFMKIIVDGREMFNGRVVPGSVYNYAGSTRITLVTGNAGGIQIIYNQQDLGILGQMGEVQTIDFTREEVATATPRLTATSSLTPLPTLTARPTATPTPTMTLPTITITPAIP